MQAQINLEQEERFWHSIPKIKSFSIMHQTAKDNKSEIDSHVELYIAGLALTSVQEDNLFMDNYLDSMTCLRIIHHGNSGQIFVAITRIHDNYYNLAKSGGKE